MSAEVVTLYETNCADMPNMLRLTAECIESETDEHDRTVSVVCLQIRESGDVDVFGWGETDQHRCIAMLEVGKAHLIRGLYD